MIVLVVVRTVSILLGRVRFCERLDHIVMRMFCSFFDLFFETEPFAAILFALTAWFGAPPANAFWTHVPISRFDSAESFDAIG